MRIAPTHSAYFNSNGHPRRHSEWQVFGFIPSPQRFGFPSRISTPLSLAFFPALGYYSSNTLLSFSAPGHPAAQQADTPG
jgi:hypothetical protein